MDTTQPQNKKQNYDDIIYDLLVPVDPIDALDFCMPLLVFKTSSSLHDSCDSPVFTVEAKYRKKTFKGMHPDGYQALLKTAHKVLDAYIKHIFTSKNRADFLGKIYKIPKKGKEPLIFIIGRQTIFTFKQQKECSVYSFFQLHPSIKIKVIPLKSVKPATVSSWIATGRPILLCIFSI